MMTTRDTGPVVAGADHSTESSAVISYAAWEAERRGLALRLVRGLHLPAPCANPLAPFLDEPALISAAEKRLTESTAWVRRRYPGLAVSTMVAARSGGGALVAESPSASLVIVGARGEGGFAGLLVGSVAAQVSKHALAPVIVVRTRGPQPDLADVPGRGAVLVGVDGSPGSVEALGFGFDEALARDVPLVAVHAWSVLEMETTGQILDDALAGWRRKFPQVRVVPRSVHGDEPARVLLRVAEEVEAGLIVVGTRADGAQARPPFHAVSQTLVAHASASVAIGRRRPDDQSST